MYLCVSDTQFQAVWAQSTIRDRRRAVSRYNMKVAYSLTEMVYIEASVIPQRTLHLTTLTYSFLSLNLLLVTNLSHRSHVL